MTNRSSGTAAVGAQEPDELRRHVEEVRGRLGGTLGELAGRADVAGRARVRAADLRDKAGAMTVQLRSSAAQAGHTVRERASRAGRGVPGPVRTGLRQPRPVLIAGAVVVAAVAAGVVWRRGDGRR